MQRVRDFHLALPRTADVQYAVIMKAHVMKFLLACLLMLGVAGAAHAQRFAIVGAEIFDGTGAPPFRGTVVVADGLIESVTPGANAPSGIMRIEADGLALLPGFHDLHTHYTPNGAPASAPQISAAYAAAGVTTVNDFHQQPESFAARRAWYAGLPGPDVRFAARMSTPGGHGADWADINTTRWANTPNAAKSAVAALVPYQPDLIKVFADGWRYGSGIDNTSMDLPTLSALVETAHASGLKVVTHTVTVERGKIAARAGVDAIVHSLQDAPVDADLIALMLKAGTAYAPTLAVYEPVKPGQTPPASDGPVLKQRAAKYEIALSNVKALHAAGVLIALGTDAGMPGTPHGASTLREMELLVRAGLTPSEALVAGTSGSARAMGLTDRGVIAAGKRADLVLIQGKPWQVIGDVRNTIQTFVGGKTMYGPGAPGAVSLMAPDSLAIANSVVIDFERPDGRTSTGALPITDADSGVDRSAQIMTIAEHGAGGHFLLVAARMAQRADPKTQIILPLTPGSVVPVDARRYSGVRFDVRGQGEYGFGITTLGGAWSKSFEATPTWTTVSASFSGLAPAASGVPWLGQDLIDLRFVIARPGGTIAWLEIDNVEFY
jgi:imidazolonepropionase-like amidohydrolase